MKTFLTSLFLIILCLSACDNAQKTTCIESEKFVMRADTCSIVDGYPINKHVTTSPSYLFDLYLEKYPCCLSQIKKLSLDTKHITKASLSNLEKFTNLQSLKLTGYDSLPDVIGNLIQLKKLQIVNPKKEIFIPNSVQNLTKLKEVIVWASKFPSNLVKVPNLESLITNGIHSQQYFPKNISSLRKLKRLDIGYSSIFPNQIIQLKKLTYLKFEFTLHEDDKIDSSFIVPSEISNLTKLSYLNLTSGELDTLPKSIGKLTHLKTLYLPYLTKAPTSLNKLQDLEYLYITRSKMFPLKGIEEVLAQLPNIKQLSYSSMKLGNPEKLVKPFSKLTRLEKLDFIGDFSDLPNRLFIPSIKHLYIYCPLKKSPLKLFPQGIFRLKKLEDLTIFNTNISFVPNKISSLENLRALNLKYNQIKKLPPSLHKLNHLQYLGIEKKNLKANKRILDTLKLKNPQLLID